MGMEDVFPNGWSSGSMLNSGGVYSTWSVLLRQMFAWLGWSPCHFFSDETPPSDLCWNGMPSKFVTHLKYTVLSIRILQTQRRCHPPRKKIEIYIYIHAYQHQNFLSWKIRDASGIGDLDTLEDIAGMCADDMVRQVFADILDFPKSPGNQRLLGKHLITGPRQVISTSYVKAEDLTVQAGTKNSWTFPGFQMKLKPDSFGIMFLSFFQVVRFTYIYIYLYLYTYIDFHLTLYI